MKTLELVTAGFLSNWTITDIRAYPGIDGTPKFCNCDVLRNGEYYDTLSRPLPSQKVAHVVPSNIARLDHDAHLRELCEALTVEYMDATVRVG